MMQSVQLLRQVTSVSLGEAHDIVHDSKTWADDRQAQEQLTDDFAEALRQLEHDQSKRDTES